MRLEIFAGMALTLIFLTPFPLSALTPEEVAAEIQKGALRTVADRMALTAESERLKTEGNLPDPELEGEYLVAPSGERNRWGMGVSWGIEWPGVYSGRRKEAGKKLSAAETALEAQQKSQLVEVKKLLLDYVLAVRQLDILGEIQAANDSIMALSRRAMAGGELTRLDMNKLRLEQAMLEGNIATATDARGEAVTALNGFYGRDCTGLLQKMTCEFPAIIVPDSVDVEKSAAVRSAVAEAEAAGAAAGTVRAESLPGLSIGYRHAYEDGVHFNGATLGVSIPLLSRRGKQRAAKAALAEAELRVDEARGSVRQQTEGTIRRLLILQRQIAGMREITDNTENEALLMKAYKGGVVTLIEYLNERNYYTNARLEVERLRHSASGLMLDLLKY